eukprot:XP_011661032.1 PREDICTED: uncharacterized protein LOC105436783 [Strongylocentrotus purpuratus]
MNLSSPSSIYAVIFYSLQFIFGIPGNVLIIVVYMRKKRKISTDILIISQGIIDLVASLLAPINILKSISDRLTIRVICRITLFGNNSLAFASLFLTAAIAFDRFFFVCRPYGKRTSNKRALCLAVACWVLGSSLTCTKLIFVEAVPSTNGQKTCLVIDTLHIFDKLEAWLKTSGFVLALVVSSVMYGKIYQTIRHQAKIHAQLVGGASKRAASRRTAFQLGEGLKQPEIDVSHAYDSGLAQSLNAAGKPSDMQEATAIERCPQSPRTSYLQVNRNATERDQMTHNSVSSAFDNYRSASQLTLTHSQANTVPIRIRDSKTLEKAFCVKPLYLRHDKQGSAVDFMHWQIPLSRRFRSLKLWFVLRSFGVKKLQEHVRRGVRLGHYFEKLVLNDAAFEIPAERILGLIVFRLKGPNGLTQELLRRLNYSGKIYVVPASIKGLYVIRFTVTSTETTEDDILEDWRLIQSLAREIFVSTEFVANVPTRMASWPGALNLTGAPGATHVLKNRKEIYIENNNEDKKEEDEENESLAKKMEGMNMEEKANGPPIFKPGRERKTCLKKLMNYRKKMGRRTMSEDAESYGYPFNAFYSFEDTSSGLPSPCEDLDDQEFVGEDEVFGSNGHAENGFSNDEVLEQPNDDDDDKETATPIDSPKAEDQNVSFPPTPEHEVTTVEEGVAPTNTTSGSNFTKLEFAANGQAQAVIMGTEKPVDVGVASKGRFGALSLSKESTYNGVVNICHYRSTKGSTDSTGEAEKNE